MKKVVLASSSPRRKELMKLLGIPFETVSSDFPEESIKHKNPKNLVRTLALEKARTVHARFKNAVVIGSDTVVYCDGRILGKPKDNQDAKKMLRLLSGKKHLIITGYAVVDSGKSAAGAVSATVKMSKLKDSEIEAYIATGEPMDKAGAYAVQGRGDFL